LDSAVVFIKTRSGFFVTTPRIGLQQLSWTADSWDFSKDL
jgi:hypothetical protein